MKTDVEKICEVINRHDPGDDGSKRPDRYAPEAETLLDRIVTAPLTAQYVRDVWLTYFGIHTSRIGYAHSDRRHPPMIRVADMPMRPEFEIIADELNALFVRKGPR